MVRWVLFDLDGTLTDPKPGITGCIAHAMRELGHPVLSADELTWCIGPPLRASLCKLVGEDQADAALAKYRERFSEIGLFENAVYPGIPECLDSLNKAGYRLALATSKPLAYADRIIAHFGLVKYFAAMYGSEMSGARADKGELIAYVLEKEGIAPSEAVMIGDRRHDLEGAAVNSVLGIGVTYGYGSQEELESAGAFLLCAHPSDIPTAVAEAGLRPRTFV